MNIPHIPHGAVVELSAPERIPYGVGRWKVLEPGLRGVSVSGGYGYFKYVRFADGTEGTVPISSLEIVRERVR